MSRLSLGVCVYTGWTVGVCVYIWGVAVGGYQRTMSRLSLGVHVYMGCDRWGLSKDYVLFEICTNLNIWYMFYFVTVGSKDHVSFVTWCVCIYVV